MKNQSAYLGTVLSAPSPSGQALFYQYLFMTGKLNVHLCEIDSHANEMFTRLSEQIVTVEGVTEALKAGNQIEWVSTLNGIQKRTREIFNFKLIHN